MKLEKCWRNNSRRRQCTTIPLHCPWWLPWLLINRMVRRHLALRQWIDAVVRCRVPGRPCGVSASIKSSLLPTCASFNSFACPTITVERTHHDEDIHSHCRSCFHRTCCCCASSWWTRWSQQTRSSSRIWRTRSCIREVESQEVHKLSRIWRQLHGRFEAWLLRKQQWFSSTSGLGGPSSEPHEMRVHDPRLLTRSVELPLRRRWTSMAAVRRSVLRRKHLQLRSLWCCLQ
jgi:hypothetical protein